MSSKRNLRRKQCTGKRQYATEQEARYAIYKGRQAGNLNGHLRAYKCSFCKQWHIGHVKHKYRRHRTRK
jgi:hypothetical protein